MADIPAPVTGAAAGQALDPYPLSPGDYDYSYTVNSLTLTLDAPDEVGASYFATDSRFSDPLWSLGISAQGVLNSNADLVIDFQSNPILGLDDSLIDSEVRAAFSVSSGTAVLHDFELFDTTYLVDQPITFAEGVNAGILPIREPSALDLLASALALCTAACGFRARDKCSRKFCRSSPGCGRRPPQHEGRRDRMRQTTTAEVCL